LPLRPQPISHQIPRLLLILALGLTATAPSINNKASAATTRCSRVGDQRIVQGTREICRPVGGQLLWVSSSRPSTTTTAKPPAASTTRATPTTPPKKPTKQTTPTTTTTTTITTTVSTPPDKSDYFPTRPFGLFSIRKEASTPSWNLRISRIQQTYPQPHITTHLELEPLDNWLRDSCLIATARIAIYLSYDGGAFAYASSSRDCKGFQSVGAVPLLIAQYSGLSGVKFFGDGAAVFLERFPSWARDNDTPVIFWVRITSEQLATGFGTESGWIPVNLRNWPYQRT